MVYEINRIYEIIDEFNEKVNVLQEKIKRIEKIINKEFHYQPDPFDMIEDMFLEIGGDKKE